MTMTVAIMFAVAGVAGILGLALLFRLRQPLSEARTYAYRMVAVMALALAAVLAMSASAMWSWNDEIASGGAT
ncbi:hypothetical protein [Stakelama saccharophila]|uniref:Uncharacterized protein n=1 Tax=Stakelama saccharophila TaxID=3075605 RepID=A0ABZ0BB91_9SPHN|nr:hypothetical protein [Stakelama sp. W311]WNO54695.1 hypothetical protein RPR59_05450 [Stakelama sp. W311]